MYRMLVVAAFMAAVLFGGQTIDTSGPATVSIPPAQSMPDPAQGIVSNPGPAVEVQRITGADLRPCWRRGVCGTDLGIPFERVDGTTALLFGDTFLHRDPARQVGPEGWRSPVMLFSSVTPGGEEPFAFTGTANAGPDGFAKNIMDNRWYTGEEHTVIPTDGISFSETGDTIVSYMSIHHWDDVGESDWTTNYAGLAFSRDGHHFERIGPIWPNNADNTDPFQMWSMQRDGDWVYIASTRAGRQTGPMMMMRVPWDSMLDRSTYECWNGDGWGGECVPLSYGTGRHERSLVGRFGEPSLRKFSDGTWVLSYLEQYHNPYSGSTTWRIVTRTATSPTGPWSGSKVQVTEHQFPRLYGGYPHHGSTRENVFFFVSTWREQSAESDQRYDVTIFRGSV